MSINDRSLHRGAVLALADGRVFRGYSCGAEFLAADGPVGEVVFNTSMYGYQEILTDPSYAGQIMCFTTPHIGNVGCNSEDDEGERVFAEGVIIRDLSKIVSNFRAQKSLHEYLQSHRVMGLYGIDTRELVSHLRDQGAQMGAMASGEGVNPDDLVDRARAAGSMEGKDYVRHVTCKEAYSWNELPWVLGKGFKSISTNRLLSRPHVVAIDCGVKRNILRLLVEVGFRVSVVPAFASAEQVLELNPEALFLSNGPGDPATVTYTVKTVEELLGKLPIFGICLGHQILAQAVGGKTYKLKFGHRGGNHPVRDETTGKVEITVQNHGFAVDSTSLPEEALISHINLNDGTVEGLEIPHYRSFCVQYHPEASPGPHDARYLFQRFFERVVKYRVNGGGASRSAA